MVAPLNFHFGIRVLFGMARKNRFENLQWKYYKYWIYSLYRLCVVHHPRLTIWYLDRSLVWHVFFACVCHTVPMFYSIFVNTITLRVAHSQRREKNTNFASQSILPIRTYLSRRWISFSKIHRFFFACFWLVAACCSHWQESHWHTFFANATKFANGAIAHFTESKLLYYLQRVCECECARSCS